MKGPVCLLLASFVVVIGCSSSSTRELSTESRNADDAITKAENAGAKRYSAETLESAREDLSRARIAEDAALRERTAAKDQLALAKQRDERARRRIAVRKALLQQEEEERKAQSDGLEQLKTHADELRAKGVPEEDVTRLVEERQSLIKIRMKQLDAEIESINKEITAMEAVRKDSALDMQTARARLKSADDRLAAARSIYLQVEERANLARAEALDARRGELSEKIGQLSP